jgi:hypothetical protein
VQLDRTKFAWRSIEEQVVTWLYRAARARSGG